MEEGIDQEEICDLLSCKAEVKCMNCFKLNNHVLQEAVSCFTFFFCCNGFKYLKFFIKDINKKTYLHNYFFY